MICFFLFYLLICFYCSYTWIIPLTYSIDGSSNVQREWFDLNQNQVILSVPVNTKWIKVNYKQVGYYRVNYEENIWEAISADLAINPQVIIYVDSLGILQIFIIFCRVSPQQIVPT